MEKRKRVAVHGNSIPMAGIAASLKADPSLEILCVNLDSPDTWQSLNVNDLTAIVFDLNDPPRQLELNLLHHRPGLLLIGIDPSRDELLVLSSHPSKALSMADLISVIHQKEFPSNFFQLKKHEMNNQE